MGKFQILLCDPPWEFHTYSDKGKDRSPDKHYNTMTLKDIEQLPVSQVTDERAGLFLWVPDVNIEQGLKVMNSWGFRYKTMAFVWYKTKKDIKSAFKKYFGTLDLTDIDFNNVDVSELMFRIGLGYGPRKQTEICLYGTKELCPIRKDKSVRQVISGYENMIDTEDIYEPIKKHSAKPLKQYNKIEALYDGPYLELFARNTMPGWTALGNEIDGKDIRDALKDLIEEKDMEN